MEIPLPTIPRLRSVGIVEAVALAEDGGELRTCGLVSCRPRHQRPEIADPDSFLYNSVIVEC